MINLLNQRIQNEEESARIYLAMSIWLGFNGFSGAEKVWLSYANEELSHAKWAYDYLMNLNIKPVVPPLKDVPKEFTGLPQVIAMSYAHEIDITNQCQELAKQAQQEGDFMSFELALKYCKEQVEELAKTQAWIDKLNSFGTDKIALRLLDDEMAG
jgi:ferritin